MVERTLIVVIVMPVVLLLSVGQAVAQTSAAGGIYLHQLQKMSWSPARTGQRTLTKGIQQQQLIKPRAGSGSASLLLGNFSPLGPYGIKAATKPKPKATATATAKSTNNSGKRSLCRLILSGLGRAFTPLWSSSGRSGGVDPLELEDICMEIEPLSTNQSRAFTADMLPPPSLNNRTWSRP